MNLSKLLLRLIPVVLVLTSVGISTAQARGSNWRDLKGAETLPEFCNPTRDEKIQRKWQKKQIGGIVFMNHYCESMARLPSCDRQIGKTRERCLEAVLSGFIYVENHTGTKFLLRPMVLVDHGRVLAKLGRYREAMLLFEESIAMKPGYSRAYIALAWAYVELGQREFAIESVRRGLSQIPDSITLRRMLEEFSS